MLTERIKERCESAKPIGAAYVTGYIVKFIKKSIDGSGKATLVKTNKESDVVYGVLFNISEKERQELDRAEGVGDGGYEVKEDLTVIHNDKPVHGVRTYIAPKEKCRNNLLAYDWYLALVIAGARQHVLDETYIQKIVEGNKVKCDTKSDRKSKIKAMEILKDAGFEKVISELKYFPQEKSVGFANYSA